MTEWNTYMEGHKCELLFAMWFEIQCVLIALQCVHKGEKWMGGGENDFQFGFNDTYF